jgi:dTDP-4-amino-4,6-dideoxygalactose transaminase
MAKSTENVCTKMEKFVENYINRSNSSLGFTTTSNGTTTLNLVLMSFGIGESDKFVVPDFGFISPVNATLKCGTTPVGMGVNLNSWCLDPDFVSKAIIKNKSDNCK